MTVKLCRYMSVAVILVALATVRAHGQHPLFDFRAKVLVAVSDADMPASAYADNRLGPDAGRDALSVVRLGGHPADLQPATIEVSNGVQGPPAVLAVTPDGRWAVVVETLKPRTTTDPAERMSDLALGVAITVVSIEDTAALKVTQRIDAPGRPSSVSLSTDGTLVAVTLSPGGAGSETPLVLYRFSDGRLGEPTMPHLDGWRSGERLIDASFHPSDNILTLVNATRPELTFLRVDDEGGRLSVQPWGNPVAIEGEPYMARFTPDGRHVVVNATYARSMTPSFGVLLSVRLDSANGQAPVRHRVVSRAETGSGPEGFAISPDGRLVASVNLERTSLPFDHPQLTPFSTVTLLRLDPDSGRLTRLADAAYDGILPESVVFDNSSRYLAVATFDHFDERQRGGSIDFWRIATDPADPSRVVLVKTDHSVRVRRGAHTLAIIR